MRIGCLSLNDLYKDVVDTVKKRWDETHSEPLDLEANMFDEDAAGAIAATQDGDLRVIQFDTDIKTSRLYTGNTEDDLVEGVYNALLQMEKNRDSCKIRN